MKAFWLAGEPLVLASGSRARRALLEAAALPLEIIKPTVDEAPLAAKLLAGKANPRQIAAALALAKARDVSARHPGRVILAADQTLDLAGQLGMKAPDLAAARAQLLAMRGRSHQLHAAAVLMRAGEVLWQGDASATLQMRVFSEAFLDLYLQTMGARVLETVGGYELEALGPHLFSAIEGEQATILGLPLQGLLEALRAQGLLAA